jgi:hypothetical protein
MVPAVRQAFLLQGPGNACHCREVLAQAGILGEVFGIQGSFSKEKEKGVPTESGRPGSAVFVSST